MTGSLTGAEKYGSPCLTSQSSGYEPINAPAAAISAMTVLEFTTFRIPASHAGTKVNHGVSPRQPALAGICACAWPRRTMPKTRRPHHQFHAHGAQIEVTVMSQAKRQSKGPVRGYFFDKSVVVTGASSGIGHGVALAFGEQGANVALLARRRAQLEELAHKIDQGGRQGARTRMRRDRSRARIVGNRAG